MKRIAIGLTVAVLLACSWAPLLAQSLAEVARKERERRARLSQESPVIGEEELERGEGATFEIAGEQRAEIEREEPAVRQDAPKLTEKEIRDLRVKWQTLWRERMASARKKLDRARDDSYQCRSAESFFFVPLAVDCEGVEERLAQAEAQLKEIQANRYNWELLLPR